MLRKCCVTSLVFMVTLAIVLILPVNANATRGDNCLAMCQDLHSRGIALSTPCNESRLDELLRNGYCEKGESAYSPPGAPTNTGTKTPIDIITYGPTRAPDGHPSKSWGVGKAIDGDDHSKFFNFVKIGSGFTVTFSEQVVMNNIVFTASDGCTDQWRRCPTQVKISGSNDESPQRGFEVIADVELSLPENANWGSVYGDGDGNSFENSKAYTHYRVVITDVDGESRADSFEFAEVEFYNTGATSTPQMGALPFPTSGGTSPTNTGQVQETGQKQETELFKCGEAQCVCRPKDRTIDYDDGIRLPTDLYTSKLPVCHRSVRPNGTIIHGAAGYAAALENEQRNIDQWHEFAQNVSNKFKEARNLCTPKSIYLQNCPSPTTLDQCIVLLQMPTPSSELSPFEMGFWRHYAEDCLQAMPQCLPPGDQPLDPSWIALGESTAGIVDAAADTSFTMGFLAASGASSEEKLVGLCGTYIPGCGIAAALAGGDTGEVIGAVVDEVVGGVIEQAGGSLVMAGIHGALSFAEYIAEKNRCDNVKAADREVFNSQERRSLADKENSLIKNPEALEGMDENIKATGDFNDAYQKQEWSEDEDEKNKCRAIPATQQCTKMVGECLWLQWCKEFQRIDDAKPVTQPTSPQPVIQQPAVDQACLRVCMEFPPHLQNDSIRDGCSPAGLERLKNGFCGGNCNGC